MRITKVNVEKKMVLMHRRTRDSHLIIGDDLDNNKTDEILPGKKLDSFRLSLLNKTIPKEENLRKDLLCEKCKTQTALLVSDNKNKRKPCNECKQIRDKILGYYDKSRRCKKTGIVEHLKRLIQSALRNEFIRPHPSLKNITEEDINKCLSYKFRNKEVFYEKNGNKGSFYLSKLIFDVYHNNGTLQQYYDWSQWHIETKTKFLKKSILNNTIDITTNGLSPRKKALKKWETEYLDKNDLDLTTFETNYSIGLLCTALNKVYQRQEFKEKINDKNKTAFHIALKEALQAHQKTIFGTKDNPLKRDCVQLSVYHLEVVKYLERYFPIKQSKRRNSHQNILYYLEQTTITKTISNQLINAIKAGMVQQGKIQLYDYDQQTTSKELSDNKTREAFVLQLVDACAFAANNLRNITDPEQKNDILGYSDFEKSLPKAISDAQNMIKKLNLFYPSPIHISSGSLPETLWAIRGSVQNIRNNIIHFKKEAIDKIFDFREFEFAQTNQSYLNCLCKLLLEKELANIPAAIAEKLKSGGVLNYYNIADLKAMLQKIEFTLTEAMVPFAPGFKRMFKQGCNFLKKGEDSNEYRYTLGLSHFKPQTTYDTSVKEEYRETEEQFQSRYFLLKLIYNNLFLSSFTDNDSAAFRKAVGDVLAYNKTYNQEKADRESKRKNKPARPTHQWAFHDIRPIENRDSISGYMTYIQSQLIQEQNKKSEETGKKDNAGQINFDDFLKQVFIKGFDNFLTEKGLDFIHLPEKQIEEGLTNQKAADKLNALAETITKSCNTRPTVIQPDNPAHIAFYTFCRLLDANHLATLRNELIKYRQATGQDSAHFNYSNLLETIELCLLNVDMIPLTYKERYATPAECHTMRIPFMDDNTDPKSWGDLFVQSDGDTPVMHAGIELSVKYGTQEVLKSVIQANNATFKVKKAEYQEWEKLKVTIADDSKQRAELHAKWVALEEANKKKKRENKKHLPKQEKDNYLSLCQKIDRYNWLDNKLHFEHLRRLHNLLIDILGRMAGFMAIWDRDFQMLDARLTSDQYRLDGFVSFKYLIDEGLNNKKIMFTEITGIDTIINKATGLAVKESERGQLLKELNEKRTYFSQVFFNNSVNTFGIRNHIAHFNYLTKEAKQYSLADLINLLRDMLHYDRKLKNAVAKSIIDMFEKHGMELKFKIEYNTHTLQVDTITPRKIYHLGTKPGKYAITTGHVPQEFCDLCKYLLELKN